MSGRARPASTRRAGSIAPSDGFARRGHVYEQDGATWFRSTAFGDDKDRVIYRSTGEPTYFASDIGYVSEKFSRGFDKLIYVWGADHHGTVARVRNAAQAMGFDKDAVEMLMVAWVRFVRDGVEIPMSKRSGEFLTLDELLEEIGVDGGPLVVRLACGQLAHRRGHRAGAPAVGREPGLLRPVRARPDLLHPGQGRGRPASTRAPSFRGVLGGRRGRHRASLGTCCACPRSSRTPPAPRRRRG